MKNDGESLQREMEEVDLELMENNSAKPSPKILHELEEGLVAVDVASSSSDESLLVSLTNLLHLILSPIFIQAFVMTFLAEWGDRSQVGGGGMWRSRHVFTQSTPSLHFISHSSFVVLNCVCQFLLFSCPMKLLFNYFCSFC